VTQCTNDCCLLSQTRPATSQRYAWAAALPCWHSVALCRRHRRLAPTSNPHQVPMNLSTKATHNAGAELTRLLSNCTIATPSQKYPCQEGMLPHLQALRQDTAMKWCLPTAHLLTVAPQSCPRMGHCVRHTLYIARAARTGRTGHWHWRGPCLLLLQHVQMACRVLVS
jgi:hypothetical protein